MNDPGFRYLNLENTWPQFIRTGLIIREDGALTLAQVPQAETPIVLPLVGDWLTKSTAIAEDPIGNLYIADPIEHRILRQDVCTGNIEPLPYLGGEGDEPGQLRFPHGVLVGPRNSLYIADSGNHRIQVIDLATLQVRAIWGQPDPWITPTASDASGRFQTPWDLAQDRTGSLYIAEAGIQTQPGVWQGGRIQKFNADGQVDLNFWTRMQTQAPEVPLRLAIAPLNPSDWATERLLVLNIQTPQIQVYHLDGSPDAEAAGQWQNSFNLSLPTGIVLAEGILYVSDAATGQVWVFAPQGTRVGTARGYQGAIAGLGLDRKGRLLVAVGGDAIYRLFPNQAFVETGHFLAGPFVVSDRPTHWSRLQVIADPLTTDSHVQLFAYTSQTAASPSSVPNTLVNPVAPDSLTPIETWRAIPQDELDLLVLNEPAQYLWIAGVLRGEGSTSPILHQMRLEFDRETWLRYLPAIYQRQETSRLFLERSLSLFENLLRDEENRIENLPLLFDAQAAPDRPSQPWLDWLAGWLAFELDKNWNEEKRRQALSDAFALYDRRGTSEGLRRFIQLYTGVTARIEEPAQFASLWSLGEVSILGFNTMLAPASGQGAVLGSTATLDRSHLIRDEDYGAPLFEDIAHHFCVQVYTAKIQTPDTLQKIQQIVDQEKPAHTVYHLCPIAPQMRIGYQARLGIDAIVAGSPPNLVLNQSMQLGIDTVLVDAPDSQTLGGRMGKNSRIGTNTNLS